MMEKIINRPVLAVIFFSIILLLGAYSLNNMTVELVPDPDRTLPVLSVNYSWPGVSPDVILQKVLIPAENEIMKVKGVAKLKSNASSGNGQLEVEFNRNVNMKFASLVMRERLNRLQKDFSRSVSLPSIIEDVPDEFKRESLFQVGLYGDKMSIYQLRRLAEKEIVPYLKSISGVERVDLRGGVEPEIKINTRLDELKKYQISLDVISQRLSTHFFSKRSLSFKKDSGEITLSLTELPEDISEIQNIFLIRMGNKVIFLKDVADVHLGFQKLRSEYRFQGESYVIITIDKEARHSHLKVASSVREKLNELASRLNGRVSFVVQKDESKDLREQLTRLGIISILILVIIYLILLVVVRDMKATLLIFSSVFFSVFATFTALYLLEIDLNLLTLSGLALGFGMFVDNAVVVFDSILRYREKGYDRTTAAVEGSRVVIMPVLASTFTTIIVFFSFAILFKDRLRIYYLPLAWVIAISLLSSIVVAYALIPSLAARMNLRIKNKPQEQLFKRGRVFPFILRYPLTVIVPIIVILLMSYNIFKKEVSFGNFFGWFSKDAVTVWLRFPNGTEFDTVKDNILKFEKLVMSKSFAKEVNTQIYELSAYMSVTFPPEIENSAFPVQLKQELVGVATNLAGIGVGVSGFDQEPYYYNPETGSSMPYNIHIRGYSYEKLMEIANNLRNSLLKHRRIKDCEVQTDRVNYWAPKVKYFSVRLDRDKMEHYKLSPYYIIAMLQSNLRESARNVFLKFEDKELTVEIKSEGVEELELDDIMGLNMFTFDGSPFRFRDVVDLQYAQQKGGISREKQEYWAMVQWDYLSSAKSADLFHKTVYKNLTVPVGFKKSLDEQTWRITEEEEHQLNYAILLSVFLIYLILAMLYENYFQPFLIMLAIPLALIGVFLAFWQMDYSFDASAYIGVILLMGIVVNNAILLIDNINHHLKRNPNIVDAIAIGTKERIRPILMTTLTTILGMLPMLIFAEADAKGNIWTNLALCTVGGLTTSAILILLVLPIVYYYLYKMQRFLVKPDSEKSVVENAVAGRN